MNQHMFIRNGALAIISRIKIKSKFLKSMSFRLFCVFLLIGIVPAFIFDVAVVTVVFLMFLFFPIMRNA